MMSAIFIGDGTLLIQCAERFQRDGGVIRAVVTDNTAIEDWASAADVAVVAPGTGLADRLAGTKADWLFSVANLRVIPEAVLALASQGAVNFHDGPLPDYAGLNAPVWALLNGETRHGITWHRIEGGVDEGRILVQREVDLSADDTAFSVNAKCYAAAIDGFDELLPLLRDGFEGTKQDLSGRRYFGRTAAAEGAGRLDVSQTTAAILRTVRALDHGAYWNPLVVPKVKIDGRWFAVGLAQATDDGAEAPGTILLCDDARIVVSTGDGAIELADLSPLDGGALNLTVSSKVEIAPALGGIDARRAAIKSEPHWRKALAGFAPTAPTLLPENDAGGLLTLTVPVAGSDAEAAGRIACVLSAGSGREATDLALSTSAWTDNSDDLSTWVPLRLTAQAPDAVAKTIQASLARGPFPADLVLRDPDLTPAHPQIVLSVGATNIKAPLVVIVADGTVTLQATGGAQTERALDILAQRITRAASLAVDQPLVARDLIGVDEEGLLLTAWNQTECAFEPQTMDALIAEQVARTSDAPALTFEDTTLSFAQVEARANQLGHVLKGAGVAPGHMVGLYLPRSTDLVAGAIGAWKAGGAYLPLDPTYPADRIAHYLTDSGASVVLTTSALAGSLPDTDAKIIVLDTDPSLTSASEAPLASTATPNDPAYVIYTSGSTGTPKGVVVSHRNVANFCLGMDERVPEPNGGTWLAVTSLSFDISVLELFWTLSRGFHTVLQGDENKAAVAAVPQSAMNFGLYFWGNDDVSGEGKYDLLLKAAQFADTNGFNSVWTPERHFHAFGGPFPNPSVTGAAVAGLTKNLGVRAGSCVAPLHHPARIAEEWAVIDNLTEGKAGIAFASGWQPDDFILRPENTPPANKPALSESVEQVRKLWRGEAVAFPRQNGEMHEVVTQPRPIQAELPVWVTTAGNPETWREAGRLGANVLTHLLGQAVEEVGEKIALYREARAEAGHDPMGGTVTLMLHSFLAATRDMARDIAREPMKDYLRSAAGLIKQYAWAFPAFKKPEGAANAMDIDLSSLSGDEMEGVLDFAFERYFETSGLFGTVEDALSRVAEVKAIGVDEIACLIDYGIETDVVLDGLRPLAEVVAAYNGAEDFSLAAQIERHGVTHLQCTPSMARLILMNDEARAALGTVPNLMIGGEPLPGALAGELIDLGGAHVENMYGPTETTIWSSTRRAADGAGTVDIGTPIANTTMYVLDDALSLVPLGGEGELVIGGEGVTLGYHGRADLTAERFPDNPFGEGRLYRTGDLVRRRADGRIDFLGRTDNQVKLRGFRIELGEVEAALEAQTGVAQAVVVVREDTPGDKRLVAYVRGADIDGAALRARLAEHLPAHMVPGRIVALDRFPLTPNKKVDRARLPAPAAAIVRPRVVEAPKAVVAAAGRSVAQATAAIALVWEQVLGVAGITSDDNFFDLGGHSLLAVQAHRQLRAELGAADLSITDIFRFPKLGDLAARLGSDTAISTAKPERAKVQTERPDRSDAMARRRAMRAARGRRS